MMKTAWLLAATEMPNSGDQIGSPALSYDLLRPRTPPRRHGPREAALGSDGVLVSKARTLIAALQVSAQINGSQPGGGRILHRSRGPSV